MWRLPQVELSFLSRQHARRAQRIPIGRTTAYEYSRLRLPKTWYCRLGVSSRSRRTTRYLSSARRSDQVLWLSCSIASRTAAGTSAARSATVRHLNDMQLSYNFHVWRRIRPLSSTINQPRGWRRHQGRKGANWLAFGTIPRRRPGFNNRMLGAQQVRAGRILSPSRAGKARYPNDDQTEAFHGLLGQRLDLRYRCGRAFSPSSLGGEELGIKINLGLFNPVGFADRRESANYFSTNLPSERPACQPPLELLWQEYPIGPLESGPHTASGRNGAQSFAFGTIGNRVVSAFHPTGE
jgi:hypothetical protein